MSKKKRNKVEGNQFIKNLPQLPQSINIKDIEYVSQIDYPLFSFKHLQEDSIKNCNESGFFFKYLMRMKKLSEVGWKRIEIEKKHGFGMEKIPREKIHPNLPDFVTPEAPIFAFRATGNNLPFLGVRCGKIFHVIFIETSFGDIYNH